MPDTIPVRFRDCACPNTPHPEGDIAELRPYLDFPGGAEALRSITHIVTVIEEGEEVQATQLIPVEQWPEHLVPVYLRRGVVSWNVVDEDGRPVPLEALADLRWEDAYELGDKADDLYGGQVLAPLVKRISTSSKAGRTGVSTRQPARRSPKRPPLSASSS